jgi:hypothetical protein
MSIRQLRVVRAIRLKKGADTGSGEKAGGSSEE